MKNIVDILKKDIENEAFLIIQILNDNKKRKFEWSNKHPYYTEINGKICKFKNSYIAHINKHVLSKNEINIWKKVLNNYPNDIEKSYLDYSNKLINTSNELEWKYDKKNHSINFTNNEKIRVSLKKSMYNNEAVIVTCHPRKKHNQYLDKNIDNCVMKYFNNLSINITEENKNLMYIFKPTDSPDYKNNNNKLKKIINNYLIDSYYEIEKLEYYNNKYETYELTDAFDYEEIIEYLDKTLLCYAYYKKNDSKINYIITQSIEDILFRYINIDKYNNIKEYIKKHEYPNSLSYDFKLNYYKPYSRKKLEFVKKINEICKSENINLNDKNIKAPGKSYEINNVDFSHGIDASNKNNFPTWALFVFCKHNKISLENSITLLLFNGMFLEYEKVKKIFNEWDTEYSDEEMQSIVDDIKKFKTKIEH